MEFDSDIFISYAHLDNETLEEGAAGWVSNLHRALEVRVAQLRGVKTGIWRDPKLQGNDFFDETIVEQLPRIGVLVSVLSPRYIKSEWCVRELEEFCRASERGGGIKIGDKARVFKVLKTPVPADQHPAEIQPLLGYEFFRTDPETGRARELDRAFGEDAQRDFWLKLDDLAHDIADLLSRLEGEAATAGGTPVGAEGPVVYLADTSIDLKEEHEAVKRLLASQNIAVLPNRALPLSAPELEAFVAEQLGRARLSIHLIGRNYGIVPEGSEESVVAAQQRIAAERSRSAGLTHIAWLPAGLESGEPRQREFVERLRVDPAAQGGAELLEVSLEDLKAAITREVERLRQDAARAAAQDEAPAPGDGGPRVLYLICDQRDQEDVGPLQDHLFDRGLEVVLPVFEGDEADVREDHEESLRTCDAVMIFYGAGNELWLRRKLREIRKISGQGRAAAPPPVAILAAPPATPQKQRLRTREATVIQQPEGLRPEELEPFLAGLDGEGGTP